VNRRLISLSPTLKNRRNFPSFDLFALPKDNNKSQLIFIFFISFFKTFLGQSTENVGPLQRESWRSNGRNRLVGEYFPIGQSTDRNGHHRWYLLL
jgi:hypothetical protein